MIWNRKLFWGAVTVSAATAAGCLAVFACSKQVGNVPVLALAGTAFRIMPFIESFVFFESVAVLLLLVRRKLYASAAGWALAFAMVAICGGFFLASAASEQSEIWQWSLYLMLDVSAALLFAFAIGWAAPKWRGSRRNSSVSPNV
ncbi:hypothetical protein P3W24_18430 [Luteibacter sp. PPL201]|jgi:lysylphosphatidylglycerol synthetase-like protein (DUF2156 family)|uniref:Lipoprotein n=1 Tax=Luteibacter sahnii TaxID=3021977 RepID=A0ABT6BFL5_9GAMM